VLKRRKTEAKKGEEQGDEVERTNFMRYRPVKRGEDALLIEISTNYYKNNLYNNLKITRDPELPEQKPGFCDFPNDYGQRYFEMLTAEEQRADGSFYTAGRRNESLDTRVYALCGGDLYLDFLVQDYKAAAKQAGATLDQMYRVNRRFVLDRLAADTRNLLK
jgi:phage terminase large subunit GpA-like protein